MSDDNDNGDGYDGDGVELSPLFWLVLLLIGASVAGLALMAVGVR